MSEGTHLVVFVSLGKYGGVEAFIPLPNGVGLALAPAVVAPAAGVAIQGSIDMTKAKSTRVNTSAVDVYWMGWGHPNTLFAEPGISGCLVPYLREYLARADCAALLRQKRAGQIQRIGALGKPLSNMRTVD